MSAKAKVLAILEANKGKSISGNEIAKNVGVSRSAVWKAVKRLQEEGYFISAMTNRGYCLTADNDLLSEQSIIPLLTTRELGRKMDVFKTIDSTNSFAKSLAQLGAVHGTTIISETQTLGRGRQERKYFSPAHTGLYMSVILRMPLAAKDAMLITSCVAVAVAEAIEQICDLSVDIKWVNDLYVNGKKICGVLTEAEINMESGVLEYAVVGIGVNVGITRFPEELKHRATSILLQTGQKPSRSLLAANILNQLDYLLDQIPNRAFMEDYIRRSNLIGKTVSVLFGGEVMMKAEVLQIDDYARLIVRNLETGEETTLTSGEVSILSE